MRNMSDHAILLRDWCNREYHLINLNIPFAESYIYVICTIKMGTKLL